MDLSQLKLIFDFGLLVLIWMVQLVVYPAFVHIDKIIMPGWHERYTKGIAIIVVPLMLGKVLLSALLLLQKMTLLRIIDWLLILLVWGITFGIFVPLHNTIAKKRGTPEIYNRLCSQNWYRTVIWSSVFTLNLSTILF